MELDTGIGDALGTYYFLLREEFSAEQHSYLQRAHGVSKPRVTGAQRLLDLLELASLVLRERHGALR